MKRTIDQISGISRTFIFRNKIDSTSEIISAESRPKAWDQLLEKLQTYFPKVDYLTNPENWEINAEQG